MTTYQTAKVKAEALRWVSIADACVAAAEEGGPAGVVRCLALLAQGEPIPAWVVRRLQHDLAAPLVTSLLRAAGSCG